MYLPVFGPDSPPDARPAQIHPREKRLSLSTPLKHGLTVDYSVNISEASEGFDELRRVISRRPARSRRLRRAVRIETDFFHIVAADQKTWVRKSFLPEAPRAS